MQSFFKDMAEQKDGELTDSDLDMVAGGKSSNGGMGITWSVVSLGMGCVSVSIAISLNDQSCKSMFE